jgi:hypothetical protein
MPQVRPQLTVQGWTTPPQPARQVPYLLGCLRSRDVRYRPRRMHRSPKLQFESCGDRAVEAGAERTDLEALNKSNGGRAGAHVAAVPVRAGAGWKWARMVGNAHSRHHPRFSTISFAFEAKPVYPFTYASSPVTKSTGPSTAAGTVRVAVPSTSRSKTGIKHTCPATMRRTATIVRVAGRTSAARSRGG